MAPFFSNPNVFFFFSMGAGERTRDPSGGHKATPDGVTSHITPERSAQKPRNVWGCLEEGSPPQVPGAKKESGSWHQETILRGVRRATSGPGDRCLSRS